MIDLTPLDVRKKRGDFRKLLRGYDPEEVDSFLELAAERLEALVKESMSLKDRIELLTEQVKSQESRERAIQEALVSAQTLREEISRQASREAESVREHAKKEAALLTQQARTEVRQMREKAEAEVAQIRQQAVGDTEHLKRKTEAELERLTVELERLVEEKTGLIDELERKRTRFLRAFRSLLERELDAVSIEEGKAASEDAILELDLTGGQRRAQARMIETAALDLLADEEEALETDDDHTATEPMPLTSEEAAADRAEEDVHVVAANEDHQATHPVTAPEVTADDDRTGEEGTFEATGFELVSEPGDTEVPADVTGAFAEASEDVASPEAAEELLVDQAFTIVDEGAEGSEAEDDADLDSLVDKVLSDDARNEAEVISIDSLAPGPDEEDALDDEARAAVNRLFDREDVPIGTHEQDDGGVEDAWSRVLRGDEAEAPGPRPPAADDEPRGSWSPNFPDKARREEISGWSGPKDQSRWR